MSDMSNMVRKLYKYYPMGYDYVKECTGMAAIMALTAFWSMLRFFSELVMARSMLYFSRHGDKVLIEGAVVRPFIRLIGGQAVWFVPIFVVIFIMMLRHYIYYYATGTKSLYVMKRISSKKYVIKTVTAGSLINTVAAILIIVILLFFYYLIYVLAIPKECMPRLV